MVQRTRILFKQFVNDGALQASRDFETIHEELDTSNIPEGGALLQLLYVSVDPYMRGRMRDMKSYFPGFTPGQPINSGAVAKVLESRSDKAAVGTYLTGSLPWESVTIVTAQALAALTPVDAGSGVPLSYYIGALGMPGLTAYTSLKHIGKPVQGEKAFVSGAAGAVGQLVGQLLKNVYGLSVSGSAGSADKVKVLKEELGFDTAFNYKEASTFDELKKFTGDAEQGGIDIYYDNVGGPTLDATLPHMAKFGRIVSCGQVSQYDAHENDRYGVKNLFYVVTRQLLMQGFIVSRWQSDFPEFSKNMLQYIKDGKVKVKEHVVHGLENAPQAFVDMMTGTNIGKMVVQCAEDPTRVTKEA